MISMILPQPLGFPKRPLLLALIGLFLVAGSFEIAGVTSVATAEEPDYPVPPEALKQEGVPEGKIEGPFTLTSKIYLGTERDYWIYVPAQYTADKPACTLVVQDGLGRAQGWSLPQICDNLIHAGEMPVTIGIYVNPGIVPATKAKSQPRFNRSFEYDALGDRYARFLLEELIPEVSKKYSLSSESNDRALAGASSGGICAFNAAWERPDAFRRVLCTIGTFVGLRGGDDFPVLVRKLEPKPLRVFLQDGSNDLNIYAGDWWLANQSMASALSWAGYDVKHVWGEGGHNAKHSSAIMPDALRWLWRGYPNPITVAPNANVERRIDVLIPDAGWREVSPGHELAEAPACNASGELFFCDSKAGRIYRVGDDGKTRIFADQTGRITSLAFGPKGNLWGCKDGKQIVRYDAEGKETVVIAETKCQSLITLPNGFYINDQSTPALRWSSYDGVLNLALELTEPVSAMTPTADQAFMHLLSATSQSTANARIAADQTLEYRQLFGYLNLPYLRPNSGASAIVVDSEGRSYVATTAGIQVLDQLGRVHLILNSPTAGALNGLAFGGMRRDTLYVTAGSSVYSRTLKAKGVATFDAPVEPPKPGL
ncbi:MAG: alpha/beta hydrolase-fold protein [Aureliella sp.]